MYCGIDLGTSGVKAVILDDNQRIIANASQPLKTFNPKPLWSEQNPADWWQATCKTLLALPENLRRQIKGIGLSGQQHGATLLDKSGKVLRPAILWNDGRSFAECEYLEKTVPNFGDITGNRIMPGFTAAKCLWVKNNEPEIFANIAKVLLPKDYLRLKLSGDYASDLSDSAGTSWLNVGERQWSDVMLAATDLSEQQMPVLFEGTEITSTILPDIAKQLGLAEKIYIVGGGGDNPASAISCNVIASGRAFLSLGTSGVYFVASNHYAANPEGGVHTMCHCLPNLWHQMTVHLSAASCLSWWASIQNETVEKLLDEAENSQTNSDLLFLPYLSGERTPYNNPHAKGVFFGMTHRSKRADLTRAILEGVAFAFAQGQRAMLAAGIEINQVDVIGGGAKSLFWGDILASSLQRELIYRENREVGAALGAARLAWLADHDVAVEEAFVDAPIKTRAVPNDELVEIYTTKQKMFAELYRNIENLFFSK